MSLISCAMPTRGRPSMAEAALACFLKQTYLNRELIILDDDDCPSFPKGVEHPLVRYERIRNSRMTIPQKRNACNRLAQGSWIVHFDSDDWSHPDRLAVQVEMLRESGKPVAAFSTMHWWHQERRKAYFYEGINDDVLGNSLCYAKAWWETHPFNESRYLGTDTVFCRAARQAGMMTARPAGHLMVGLVHAGNSCQKTLKPPFVPCEASELPQEYRNLHGL